MASKQFNAVDGYTVGNATVVSVIDANANVTGNAITATANVTAPQLISNVAIGTAPLIVTSTTVVANLNANALQGSTPTTANTASTIALRDASGNLSANFFIGNGSQLTGIVASAGASIVNGTSNVVVDASANVRTSVGGVANVLVVTTTGANITGTANISGNLSAGNITTGGGSGGNITGANVISANTFTGSFANGNSNVNIATANGNVTISAVGNLNILTVTGTGVNVFGTLSTGSGNANLGNIGTAQVLATANITAPQLISNVAGGTAPLVVTSTTVVANLNANALQGSTPASANTASTIALRDASGNLSANFFIGNGSQLTGIIASGGASISNGNSNVNIPSANGNVTVSVTGNANILTVTGTGVNVFGTLNTGSGNANIGNIGTAQVLATANITAPQLISNVAGGTAPLIVTSTTVVANLNANALQGSTPATANTASTIALRDTNGNLSANFFIGNGSQLTGIVASGGASISNGTSNVNIATSGGNVTTSVGGTANVIVVTTTGVNVAGTFNTGSGNANVGNLGTAQVLATANITAPQLISNVAGGTAPLVVTSTTVVANLNANALQGSTPATANTASTIALRDTNGNLSANFFIGNGSQLTGITGGSSIVNGTSNVVVAASGNVTISSAGNLNILTVTGTGVNVFGTFSSGSGNANVGNLGTAQVLATANITAPQLISNIATGTAPFIVTSNTVVANLNADLLEGFNPATANTASTIALRDANGNVSANFFIGNGSQLTGIVASGGASISNGTSNVNIPASGGNVVIGVGGTANVANITTTGVNVFGTLQVNGTIDANATFPTVPFTVASSTLVTNLNAQYVSGYLPTTLATASTVAARDANGNVSANFFIGNGSQLTGIVASGGASISNGTSNVNIPASGGNVVIGVGGTANVANITSTGVNVFGTLNVSSNVAITGITTHTALTPPTADMITITNAGQGVVSAGVSGLQVTYAAGNAAIESSAARFDISPGGNSGATWNGLRVVSSGAAIAGESLNAIKVDNKTAGAGTSSIIYAGTGYDNILNYNGTTVIYGNGMVNGTMVTGGVTQGKVVAQTLGMAMP